MSKVEFGSPYLRKVRRVIQYELDGVAFIEGYEKTVSFTFEFGYSPKNLRLRMEDLYQAKVLYAFFNNLFKDLVNRASGLSKSIGLYSEWEFEEEKLETMLERIGEVMSKEWKEALKTMMSVFNQ